MENDTYWKDSDLICYHIKSSQFNLNSAKSQQKWSRHFSYRSLCKNGCFWIAQKLQMPRSTSSNNNVWGYIVKCDLFSFGLHFLPQLMLLEMMNVSLPDALCFALLTSLLLSPSLIHCFALSRAEAQALCLWSQETDKRLIFSFHSHQTTTHPPPQPPTRHHYPDAAPSAHRGATVNLNPMCNT